METYLSEGGAMSATRRSRTRSRRRVVEVRITDATIRSPTASRADAAQRRTFRFQFLESAFRTCEIIMYEEFLVENSVYTKLNARVWNLLAGNCIASESLNTAHSVYNMQIDHQVRRRRRWRYSLARSHFYSWTLASATPERVSSFFFHTQIEF